MAKDKYHDLVKNALIADGWTVTDDPYKVKVKKHTLNVDLGAEKILAAEKGTEKIAVEIKSFIGISQIYQLYNALGQFGYYQIAMEKQAPERTLFLAIPDEIYVNLETDPIFLTAKSRYQLKLIAYNIENQKIVTWDK